MTDAQTRRSVRVTAHKHELSDGSTRTHLSFSRRSSTMRDAKLAAVLLLALTGGASAALTEAECGVINDIFACQPVGRPPLTEAECDTSICVWSDGDGDVWSAGECSLPAATLNALTASDNFQALKTAGEAACAPLSTGDTDDCAGNEDLKMTKPIWVEGDTPGEGYSVPYYFCYVSTYGSIESCKFNYDDKMYFVEDCLTNGYPMERLGHFAPTNATLNATECGITSDAGIFDCTASTADAEACASYDTILATSANVDAISTALESACRVSSGCNIQSNTTFVLPNSDGTSSVSTLNTCSRPTMTSCAPSILGGVMVGLMDNCVQSGHLNNDGTKSAAAATVSASALAFAFVSAAVAAFA